MNNWEEEKYMELCICEARRGITWWKVGVWRLNNKEGICPIRSIEED
jgi:hypothetical protein